MAKITYNYGWLKDKLGNKFAPKTTTKQVLTVDNEPLSDVLEEIETGKVALPINEDETVNNGEQGQFLTSNGDGTTSWTTIANGSEVAW